MAYQMAATAVILNDL